MNFLYEIPPTAIVALMGGGFGLLGAVVAYFTTLAKVKADRERNTHNLIGSMQEFQDSVMQRLEHCEQAHEACEQKYREIDRRLRDLGS